MANIEARAANPQFFMIGLRPEEDEWVRLLVGLLRSPDPVIAELSRQALLYVDSRARAGRGRAARFQRARYESPANVSISRVGLGPPLGQPPLFQVLEQAELAPRRHTRSRCASIRRSGLARRSSSARVRVVDRPPGKLSSAHRSRAVATARAI